MARSMMMKEWVAVTAGESEERPRPRLDGANSNARAYGGPPPQVRSGAASHLLPEAESVSLRSSFGWSTGAACNPYGTDVPSPTSRWTQEGALRVPEITVYFWVIKALSTALGEATSDFLVKRLHPIPAVGLGFVVFCVALALQFTRHRYIAWSYWFAVVGVGVFGTMAADVLHVGFHVPYVASSTLYAVILAAVFVVWGRTEKTLSIHTIATPRREAFYWAAVVATFAMGTAIGDLSATTLHLGYGLSMVLFAGVIVIPAVGYRWLSWNSIFTFWFAYVVTRPLGASFADWVGKAAECQRSGLGRRPHRSGLGCRHRVLGRVPHHHPARCAGTPGVQLAVEVSWVQTAPLSPTCTEGVVGSSD